MSVNLIDQALSTPTSPAPTNLIDAALATPTAATSSEPSAKPNLIDAALSTPVPSANLNPPSENLIPSNAKIEPRSPSWIERAENVIRYGAIGHAFGWDYGAHDTDSNEILPFEDTMSPVEQAKHPVAAGILQTAGSMTTPGNIAVIAATSGLGSIGGAAGKIIPRLVSAGFSATQIASAVKSVPAITKAIHDGDYSTAENLITKATIQTGLAALGVRHAVTGEPLVHATKPVAPEEAVKPAELKATEPENDKILNASVVKSAEPVQSTKSVPTVTKPAVPVVFKSEDVNPEADNKFDSFEGQDNAGRSTFMYDGNKRVGEIHIQQDPEAPDTAVVRWSEIKPKYRGQGLGTELYKQGLQDFFDRNPAVDKVTSDTVTGVNQDALRVWNALDRDGYKINAVEGVAGNPEITRDAFDAGKKIETQASSQVIPPRPPTTIADMKTRAALLGLKPEDLQQRAAAIGASGEEVIAATNQLNEQWKNETTPAIATADLETPEGQAAATKAAVDFLANQEQVKGKFYSEAGRSLRAAQENRFEDLNKIHSDILDQWQNAPEKNKSMILQGLQKLIQSGDQKAATDFLSKVTPTSTMDKIHEAWMNGLLSGAAAPKKLLGDFSMIAVTPLEKVLSSGPAAALNYTRGMMAGIPEAFPAVAKVWGEDLSTLDNVEMAKLGIHGRQPNIKGIPGTFSGDIQNFIGPKVRIPGRAIAAVNAFAHTLHYDGSLWEQSFKTASKEGLKGADLASRAAELRENPTPEMEDAAEQESSKRTYQGKLGKLGQPLADLANKPYYRKVVPFAHIPLNILKADVQFSPLGFITTAGKALTDSEFRNSPEMYSQLARNVIGSAAFTWAYWMGRTGRMTGAPVGNTSRDVQGNPPFSIKIGDHWVSYKYVSPAAAVFAAGAGAGASEKQNPGKTGQALGTSLTSAMEATAGIPLISSITHLVNGVTYADQAINSGKSWAEAAGKFLAEQLTSVIPTAISDVADLMDTSERSPRTWQDQFKLHIPVLRGEVVPQIGPNGLPVSNAGNFGGFSPVTIKKIDTDPTIQEMARLKVPLPQRITNVYNPDDPDKTPISMSDSEVAALEAIEDRDFYTLAWNDTHDPSWRDGNITDKERSAQLRYDRESVENNGSRYDRLQAIRNKKSYFDPVAGQDMKWDGTSWQVVEPDSKLQHILIDPNSNQSIGWNGSSWVDTKTGQQVTA